MIYRVITTPGAEADIALAFYYIHERAPLNAKRWLRGLNKKIRDLELLPRRFGIAPETKFLGEELRHYTYKSHRIIFRIEEADRIVRVLYVRHGARRAVGEPYAEDDEPVD